MSVLSDSEIESDMSPLSDSEIESDMSPLSDSEIESAHRSLSKCARSYHKWRTSAYVIFFVLYFGGACVFAFGTVFEGDLFQLPSVYVTPLGLSMVLAGISGYAVSRRKAKLYRIASEYNLFLLVHAAIESLETFFKTNSQSDRRRAVEKARKVVERVEEWKVTGLQLIKHEVGRHVIPFKAKLREKLLPALGEGDDENLRRGHNFLASFAKYLIGTNPAIEDIHVLDDLLTTITTISSDNPLGLQERMTIGMMGHVIAFGICGFAGFFAFRVGYYLLYVPLETAYIAGFGFAGALIAGYLNYARKRI